MQFIFNSTIYRLSEWKVRNYSTTNNDYVLGAISRQLFDKRALDAVGLYLDLTNTKYIYKVYGNGELAIFAELYNKSYNNPIFTFDEIEQAKVSIDKFLIKIPKMISFV